MSSTASSTPGFPQILASNPTIVGATGSTVYGAWWISSFIIDGTNMADVTVTATLQKYTTDENGNVIFSPVDPPKTFVVDQVLQRATPGSPIFDQFITNVVNALLPNLQGYGQENNLI